MAAVWLNGRIVESGQAYISLSDRGFTLADGVFETIRAAGNRPLWFADHLARLKHSAATLGIPLEHDDCEIEAAVVQLLETSAQADSAIRITLTRGPSSKRGLWPPGEPVQPTLLITIAPLAVFPAQDMVVCRSSRRNEHSPLSRIKSLNYGDNLLARREAVDRGATDALMLNTSGDLACATVGNVFLRIDDRWTTPRLADGALAGLARARLIKMMDAAELPVSSASITKADAGFVSNSLGCAVIDRIEGQPLPDISRDVDLTSIYAARA
jgi:branched-chain amino acid aminotransferase